MEKTLGWVHGAGGKPMMEVIQQIVELISLKKAGKVGLDDLEDGATIEVGEVTFVMTTDSYTVRPYFFPGGNIGSLAVSGTVNDLAVMGAKTLAISSAVVLPEGFKMSELVEIMKSMDEACRTVGAAIITGDLKIVERGGLDGPIITTSGIGVARKLVRNSGLRPGDKLIISGPIGEHGACILAQRHGFGEIKSDVGPVWEVVEKALNSGEITSMKDPTRGGVAAAVNELAQKSRVGVMLYEDSIPISNEVRGLCDLLGLDPLTLACEGRVIIGVRPESAESVLDAVKSVRGGREAAIVGEVLREHAGTVLLKTVVGGTRVVPMPMGDPIPRIC